MTENDHLDFIGDVQDYPFIYDRENEDYKNTKKKGERLGKIGEKFGLTQKGSSKLYATLCRRYKAAKKDLAKKSKSGAGAVDLLHVSFNYLLEPMSFLDGSNIQRR